MNHSSRDVRGITGLENTMFTINPLLSLPRNDVDDLLPMWMDMKRVTMKGRHRSANHQELIRGNNIWPA